MSLAGCLIHRPPPTTDTLPPSTAPLPAPPPVPQAVPDAIPRVEPRSRYGNPPFYDVFGKRYYVLSSGVAYVERGVASWYGPGFHKVRTSTGEPYDMYAMSAAHKTLPLPAYVRVLNLQNGRSVVVRVNDRGPFVGNRIIDLSYAAAAKLDMLRNGTAMVEVRAIDPSVPLNEQNTPLLTAAPLTAAPLASAAVDAQATTSDRASIAATMPAAVNAGAAASADASTQSSASADVSIPAAGRTVARTATLASASGVSSAAGAASAANISPPLAVQAMPAPSRSTSSIPRSHTSGVTPATAAQDNAAGRDSATSTSGQAPTQYASAASTAPANSAASGIGDGSSVAPGASPKAPRTPLFVQAGAFSDPANAEHLAARLRGGGYGHINVREDVIAGRKMYRVRIGPVMNVPEFDRIVGSLEHAGIHDAHLALD